ncbi:class I adenylate-forming enzyme family protein [Paracoccus siganidrum]|uniref:class I adenylate-forming enzyme family protein n=1 Tax=Paracoccus siganidrum TaxID=1276757 RepID=UPI00147296EE|nr:AMP-binding protein [Paracoccus siganidrum]
MDRAIGTGFRLGEPVIGAALTGASWGDLPAHVAAGGAISHAAMRDRILRLAAGLLSAELRRGQRVGVWMPPSAERTALCAAIWWLGGVVVPLEPSLPQARLTMALQGSGLRLLVHHPQGAGGGGSFAAVRHLGCEELLARGDAPDLAQLAERAGRVLPDHPAVVLYGEGRQDTARGVVLSHRALLCAAQGLAARYGIGAGSRLAVPLPLNHTARLTAELAVLVAGAALCDLPAFSAPASHLILADADAPPQAPPPPQMQPGMVLLSGDARLIRGWQRALPQSRIFNSYLRAELAGIAICSDPRDPPHTAQTTAGRPLRGVEVMIVDPRTSMDMLLYEIGEIWIRGAPLMLRYHDDLRASRKVLDRSGFFKTGEMGYLDSEGRVIVCRDAFAQI